MQRELLDLASELARRGEPFALVTVVARQPPISAQVGDMALVTREGGFHGWVGGSCTRPTVVSEARKALEDGVPRFVVLDPDPGSRQRPGVSVFPMTCHSGGSVELHVQPVLPPPVFLVYGVSPTARALARLAKAMGYTVHAVDPVADASAFPGADSVSTDPQALRLQKPSAPVFAVVATQGQWDEDAVVAALAHEPDYLGVVASAKRFAEMRGVLAGKASEAALARVKSPAGLDLRARLPEEIALSILAQVVKEHRATAGAAPKPADAPSTEAAERSPIHSGEAERGGAGGVRRSTPPSEDEARDPVCGMAVRVRGATHRAQHQGRDFFFCCAGCRERFLATPERYMVVAAEP